jgi:hypothetical protein
MSGVFPIEPVSPLRMGIKFPKIQNTAGYSRVTLALE